MLDEVVRKPNPESNRLVSYGNNNTADYKKIVPDSWYASKNDYGPTGKQV
jgi:hypothetical protein